MREKKNDVDLAIAQQGLFSVKIDYCSMRDILLEMQGRIDRLSNQVLDFLKARELQQMQHQIDKIASQVDALKTDNEMREAIRPSGKVTEDVEDRIEEVRVALTKLITQTRVDPKALHEEIDESLANLRQELTIDTSAFAPAEAIDELNKKLTEMQEKMDTMHTPRTRNRFEKRMSAARASSGSLPTIKLQDLTADVRKMSAGFSSIGNRLSELERNQKTVEEQMRINRGADDERSVSNKTLSDYVDQLGQRLEQLQREHENDGSSPLVDRESLKGELMEALYNDVMPSLKQQILDVVTPRAEGDGDMTSCRSVDDDARLSDVERKVSDLQNRLDQLVGMVTARFDELAKQPISRDVGELCTEMFSVGIQTDPLEPIQLEVSSPQGKSTESARSPENVSARPPSSRDARTPPLPENVSARELSSRERQEVSARELSSRERQNVSARDTRTPISARSNVVSQTYEELDALTKLLQERVDDIYQRLGAVNDRLGEEDRSIKQLGADLDARATKEALDKLRVDLEDRGGRTLGDEPVYMPQLKHVAANFQNMIKGVDRQIREIQDVVPKLVSREDLTELINTIQSATNAPRGQDSEATAGAQLSYRCLLCGRPRANVTGMITEAEVARLIGEPPTSGVGRAGDDFVLVYGRDGAYRAASPPAKKKATLPRINVAQKSGARPQTTMANVQHLST